MLFFSGRQAMKVQAKIRFNYGKRQYFPGDDIDMPDKDAKLLSAAGRITIPEAAATSETAAGAKASAKRAGGAGAAAKRSAKAETSEDARGAKNAPAEPTGESDDSDDAKTGASGRKMTKNEAKSGGYKRRDVRATDDRGSDDAGATGDE
jgi:hypothetical protein